MESRYIIVKHGRFFLTASKKWSSNRQEAAVFLVNGAAEQVRIHGGETLRLPDLPTCFDPLQERDRVAALLNYTPPNAHGV